MTLVSTRIKIETSPLMSARLDPAFLDKMEVDALIYKIESMDPLMNYKTNELCYDSVL